MYTVVEIAPALAGRIEPGCDSIWPTGGMGRRSPEKCHLLVTTNGYYWRVFATIQGAKGEKHYYWTGSQWIHTPEIGLI